MNIHDWMRTTGCSAYRLTKLIGCTPPAMTKWLKGRGRPSLRWALAIERATDGAVPAKSWLDTEERTRVERGPTFSEWLESKDEGA